jgi:hypothetical protein
MPAFRTARPARVALAVAAVALSAAACGSSSGGGTVAAGTSPSPSAAVPSPAASQTAAPSPSAADGPTVKIVYAGGKVSGVGSRVKVKLGTKVTLVVTSDVADEVHLHGYDKSADVAKGGTATIAFKATIPGIFEVELEKLKHRLVQLQVQ